MPRWTARNSRDRDLDDEIVHDLELEIDELVRAGMSREKAERASRRDFGNVLYIKEDIRGRWTRTWLERLAQDLRYAARTLRRDFAFSLTALLSLVLGIGVATALFSVGARLIAMGLALGLPGTFAISSMLAGDVPKAGAWSVAAIMLVLVPVALVACYAPARRALCLDPSVALRHD